MKTMVFTMGAPGSGKSTEAARLYPTATIIDPDEFKKNLPGYDPKNPGLVHEESARLAEEAFQQAIRGTGLFVMDGTGSNAERMMRRMTEAKAQGFEVILLYVACPLGVCLARNRRRERSVPDSLVISKHQDIRYAFEAVAPLADNIRVVASQ